jgi:hypothetical protein
MSTDPGTPPALSRYRQPTVWPQPRPEPPHDPVEGLACLGKRPELCPWVWDIKIFDPTQVGPDIWVYPNLLPSDLCRHLIQKFDADHERTRHPHRKPNDPNYEENRRCLKVLVTMRPDWSEEDKSIHRCIAMLGSHYFESIYGVQWPIGDSGYEFLCYRPPNDHCNAHFDGGVPARLASVVIYLNDVVEGAETVFIRQGVKVKPTCGSAVVFPPGITHPHYVPPPISESRYSLVTWFTSVDDTFSRARLVNAR